MGASENGMLISSIAEDQIAKLLKDSGVAADKEGLKLVVEKLKGQNIPTMVAEGRGKFASMPAGGAAAPSAPAGDAPKADKKKEEKPAEDDDADLDGAMDLFGYWTHTVVTSF